MKKVILTVAALAMSASAAFGFSKATGGGLITGTPHDLSGFVQHQGTGASQTEKQICAFCHTPHNAKQNVPLWNRNDPTITLWYNTSVTLTSVAKNIPNALASDSISSFCMSCHDGVTAIGAIKNDPTNRGGTSPDGIKGLGTISQVMSVTASSELANLGNSASGTGANLADDHPIGFDYEKARLVDAGGLAANGLASDRLHTIADAQTVLGPRTFFSSGINGAGVAQNLNQIECGSCHKVHDDYIAPFLRTSNYMSRLCLACHIK
jgi:predicted CXXCH cytochrome family protein